MEVAMFQGPERTNHLFRAEAALSPSFTPDTIVGRDAELEALEAALAPLTRRATPDNVIAYGPAGVGKTTAVTHVCDQLEDQSRVRTSYINCWQYNTRSVLLSQLLIDLGYPAPRKGKPIDELLRQLHEWVAKHRCLAVVLDEFDRHRAQTDIIYDLHHVSAAAVNELGVVLISNQPPTEIHLDPRSQSRLNYRPLHFPRYDADELHRILQRRAETAFQPGVVTDEAVARITAHVAEKRGDCRHALELLHRAGRVAEREHADMVTGEHVDRSMNPARQQ